jgi:GxxExxY protein
LEGVGVEYLHSDVTERILAAAFAVHGELGPGFLESVYEKALAHELGLRGVEYQRQVKVPVMYKGAEVGKHRLDLIVEGKVIVELKTVSEFAPVHSAVMLAYLTASNLQVGLLLNFANASLEKRRITHRSLNR